MLTPHNRGQGARLPGRRGFTLWPAFFDFKNEHLICRVLKVNNVSELYIAGKAIKWPEL